MVCQQSAVVSQKSIVSVETILGRVLKKGKKNIERDQKYDWGKMWTVAVPALETACTN